MNKLITKVYKHKEVTFRAIDVTTDSIHDYVEVFEGNRGYLYKCLENVGYFSKRYNKWIIREANELSDGATGAKDINSFSWLFHDELCDSGMWEDNEPCTNLQGSTVLSDILEEEGRWFRKHTWFMATWLFGGGKLRNNGMW